MRFAADTVLPALLISILLGHASLLHAQEEMQWECVPLKTKLNLWDVSFADSLRGIAVGDYGVILRTVDGGDTWQQTLSEEQFALRRVHFFNDSVVVAAGFKGSLIRSTDTGQSWSIVRLGSDVNLSSMTSIGKAAWIGGADGALYKTTDSGITWNKIATNTTDVISSLSFADQQHGFCAAQGRLLRSDDGGDSWIETEKPSLFPVTAIHVMSADTILLADYNRTIFKSINGGKNWIRLEAYQSLYRRIAVDNNGTGWAVGKGGVVVREQPWTEDKATGSEKLAAGSEKLAAGSEKLAAGSEKLAADTMRWTQIYRSEAPWINSICFPGNGVVLAVGHNGAVLRCDAYNNEKQAAPKKQAAPTPK